MRSRARWFRSRRQTGIKIKWLISLVAALICLGGGTLRAATLEIPGTGVCEVLLRGLAAAFNAKNPGKEVLIPPSIGSKGGISLVEKGEAILARVGRPPEGDELAYGLQYLVFARDAVIFAVGSGVTIQSLTPAELAAIFSGEIANWKDVGGPPAIIRVLVREPGDASLSVIQNHLKKFKNITFANQSKMLYYDYEMVAMLCKYKNSIGFLTSSTIMGSKNSIKAIAIDNIPPDLANVQTGRYGLVVDYGLVFKENRLNEIAHNFIDFIFSDEGKAIIAKHKVIPLDRKAPHEN